MSTRSFLEVEAKFSVSDNATAPDPARINGIESVLSSTTHRLSAIYYDTEDLRLTRSKITLRRREGGNDDGWHLKLPATAGRLEIHATIEEPVDGFYEVPEDILAQVRALVRNNPLTPIAQVDNERVETILGGADGQPAAEFCDDHVSAWSLLPGGEKSTWREWEIELAEGIPGTEDAATIMQSATALLISAGARVSSSSSKLVTALGDSARIASLPPFMVEPHVAPDSPAAAVIAALALNRNKLHEYDPKVRRDEWDSVHQMRVATRELRSHMETFDGILGGEELENIEAELKLLAGMLGYARDAEVVEERFLTLLDSEDSGVLDEQSQEHLREDMGAEYFRAHRRIIATLNSERYLTLLDAIDELLAHPPVIGPPATPTDVKEEADTDEDTTAAETTVAPSQSLEEVEKLLSEHLDQAYRKLMKRHHKAVKNWDNFELTLHEREEYFHDMRKSAKKLRYAAEAVGAATSLKTKRLYNACKAMQSSLGDFQDSVTSRDRLLKFAENARRKGEDTFGYGVLYQRERAIGLEALNDYAEEVKAIKAAYARLLASVKDSQQEKKKDKKKN